ncbi:hypothetical protein C8Q73DRAFT_716839 [Cubamyces lactineus]|nr:hypothetical protein C8Q73DRAFT_716839 [Cubamyces lactineus]
MNGVIADTSTQQTVAREPQRPVQISQALARGAQEISALFERRTAALRAEYEAKIHALATEREALRAYGIVTPEDAQALLDELDDLRQERDGHTQERAEWMKERDDLLRGRQEREAECAELRRAREALLQERATFEEAVDHRVKAECETKMQEIVTAKDAVIAGLEERIRWLEANQSVPLQQTTSFDQTQSELLDMPHSPSSSTVYPDMSSTLSTISHVQSPMQVDEQSTAAPLFSRSSTITLQGGTSPPGAPSEATAPMLGSTAGVPQSPTPGAAPSRLVIRLPPATKGRHPIKPPITPPTAEELKTLVHVPLQRNSSDESSPATSPSAGSSSNTFSS